MSRMVTHCQAAEKLIMSVKNAKKIDQLRLGHMVPILSRYKLNHILPTCDFNRYVRIWKMPREM